MKKIIASLLLLIISISGLSTFALAQTNVRIKSAINIAGPGKCLDVAGGVLTTGTPIVQFDCHSGYNQRFSLVHLDAPGGFYLIKSAQNVRIPNMCVGITNNEHANPGEIVRLVPCNVNNYVNHSAIWILDDVNGKKVFRAYLISQSVLKPTCIDVPSGLAGNSLWMQLYDCHYGANQQWSILSF